MLKTDKGHNYLVTIHKLGKDYNVKTAIVRDNGSVECAVFSEFYPTLEEAEERAKTLLKTKVKSRGWEPRDVSELPNACAKHLAIPEDSVISQDMLLELLKSAHKEVLVIIVDNVGLTENFDLGVEYVGFSTEDENIYRVYDKYGDLMNCFKSRLSIIGPTERAIEAQSDRVRMIKSRMGV